MTAFSFQSFSVCLLSNLETPSSFQRKHGPIIVPIPTFLLWFRLIKKDSDISLFRLDAVFLFPFSLPFKFANLWSKLSIKVLYYIQIAWIINSWCTNSPTSFQLFKSWWCAWWKSKFLNLDQEKSIHLKTFECSQMK